MSIGTGKLTKREQEVATEYLMEVSRLEADGKSVHTAQATVATKMNIKSRQYVNEVVKKMRNQYEQNPTVAILESADKLEDLHYQMEKKAELLDRSVERYKRLDLLIDETDEYERDLRKTLEELGIALDALLLDPEGKTAEQVQAIWNIMRGRNSPLGYKSLVTTLRDLISEQRKEDMLKIQTYDSVNNSRRALAFIINNVYKFDMAHLPENKRDEVIDYFRTNICPNCEGFKHIQKDIYKEFQDENPAFTDVNYEDVMVDEEHTYGGTKEIDPTE